MLFLPPGIAFLLSELLKFNLKPTASPYQTLPLPQENPVSPGVNSSSSYVSLLGLSSLPVCVCYFCPCIFSTTWLDLQGSLGVGAWLHHLTVEATAVVLDPYLRDSSRALLNEQVSDSTLEQQRGGTNPGCLGRESASRVTVNSEEGMHITAAKAKALAKECTLFCGYQPLPLVKVLSRCLVYKEGVCTAHTVSQNPHLTMR